MTDTLKEKKIWLILTAAISVVALAVIFSSQASTALASPKPDVSSHPKSATGSIIRTNDIESTRNSARAYGLQEIDSATLPRGRALMVVDAPPTNPGLQLLQIGMRASDPEFEVFPNHEYRLTAEPNDPKYQDGDQWNLKKINAPDAWDITQGSEDVVIAVIDSGVLSSQSWEDSPDCPLDEPCTQADFPEEKMWTNPTEELDGTDTSGNGFIDDVDGWDFMGGWRGDSEVCPNFNDPNEFEETYQQGEFISEDNDPQPYSCDDFTDPSQLNKHHYDDTGECGFGERACYVGHGTLVASVAAAATNNDELIAGINWNARIMNLRALDGYGFGSSSSIAAAVEYATEMEADVINLSLAVFDGNNSCTTTDTLLEDALEKAADAGIVTVAAAGNSGGDVCYPARSEYTIAVGATDENDERADFGWWASNQGPDLDIVAPGASIPGANAPSKANNYSDYTDNAHGTSLATPHVAGLASLIKSIDSDLTGDAIERIIKNRAHKVDDMAGEVRTDKYGYGRIDAYVSTRVASGEVPVYRLYNGRVHNHLITASVRERDFADKNLRFRVEGIVFWASNKKTSDTKPVYRLYNGRVHNHLITASKNERDFAVDKLGFRYEGIIFYAQTENTSDNRAVHRLYNGRVYNHLITASEQERDFADNNLGFRYEGGVFWVD